MAIVVAALAVCGSWFVAQALAYGATNVLGVAA